jgi:hypothetical protein
LDLDVAQESLSPFTHQPKEDETISELSLLSSYFSQATMQYKTAGTGVKSWIIVTLQETEVVYLIVKY